MRHQCCCCVYYPPRQGASHHVSNTPPRLHFPCICFSHITCLSPYVTIQHLVCCGVRACTWWSKCTAVTCYACHSTGVCKRCAPLSYG